jgi:hypothetical protein
MADINVGVLAEQMNSKADIDLRNIDTTKCDMVIEYQEPTAENNYTWYRLYATGWVEQGGFWTGTTSAPENGIIDLPIAMANINYQVLFAYNQNADSTSDWTANTSFRALSTTQVKVRKTTSVAGNIAWQVFGKVDPSVMLNHEILPSKAKNEEFEHRVIEFQKPTAENNYTWYRKYADGWVEQGGKIVTDSTTFPIAFSQEPTITLAAGGRTSSQGGMYNISLTSLSASSFTVSAYTEGINKAYWQASGLYATE